MVRLEPLGPPHAQPILSGQDRLLAEEVVGARWDPAMLDAFLERAARWRGDGPVREFAAVEQKRSGSELVGGGGLTRLGAGLERGQAAMTYWVLARCRGCGHGRAIATALAELAHADPRIGALVLRIAPGNDASRAVARGLGAVPTGVTEPHPAGGGRTAERWVLELG